MRSPTVVAFIFGSIAASPVAAQIVPDTSLPQNAIVAPNGSIFVIDGGTASGANLFHSFSEFSVPTGTEAYFNNAVSINNIITRVTGENISTIDGLIRANGTASLFLLNPNGIVFGENARLDIGGSFFASSSESWQFADGSEFSATESITNPLLTVSVPIGLQLGDPYTGTVENRGNLSVNPGQNLGIGGFNISNSGQLSAPGGTVQLVANEIETSALNNVNLGEILTSGDLLLQGNNNVRIDSDITGGTGNLTLESGRGGRIAENRAIVLEGGDFSAILNSENARAIGRDVEAPVLFVGGQIATNGGNVRIEPGRFGGEAIVWVGRGKITLELVWDCVNF